MKINIESQTDLNNLRNSTPDDFWGGVYLQLAEELNGIVMPWVKGAKEVAASEMKKQLRLHHPLPLHLMFPCSAKGTKFNYFVHFFASSADEANHPQVAIIAFLGMPGESFYAFLPTTTPDGELLVDFFTPHCILQYAKRAPRHNVEQRKVPESLELSKLPIVEENTQLNEKAARDLVNLNQVMSLFMGHNKNMISDQNPTISSRETQKTSNNDGCFTLWMDGITYDRIFYEGHMLMHVTYIHHEGLYNDQKKAILEALKTALINEVSDNNL